MSIKSVKMLATSPDTTSSDVVNYDFRSPKELEVYLDSMGKDVDQIDKNLDNEEKLFAKTFARSKVLSAKVFTLDRYGKTPKIRGVQNRDIKGPHVEILKIPKVESLRKNFGVVTQLHDKLDTLESLEAQIKTVLKDVKGQSVATKHITTMKTHVKKTMQKALDFLNKIATKHEPMLFKETVDAVCKEVLKRVEGRIKKSAKALYVTVSTDENGDTFWFTKYLGLAGLVDDNDYEYSTFYVVFTAQIDPAASMTFYVNTLTKFKAPGTFNVGSQFDDPSSGGKVLDALLAHENFSSLAQRMHLPIKPGDTSLKNIKMKGIILDVEVSEDHSVIVTFAKKVTREDLEAGLINIVFEQLRKALSPSTHAQLKYRPFDRGGYLAAEFMYLLPPPDATETLRLNIAAVERLKNVLGLSEKQVDDIVKMLHH